MGLFRFWRYPDINRGVEEFRNADNAVLLDVRTPREYREGHIPGSLNVPLQSIENVEYVADDKDTALYVYSGVRSRQAVSLLKDMGYANVSDIGGISAYVGKVS